MKKRTGFFIFLITLLGVGAAGFFLGWAQFAVPPGSVGIMRSKTHGVDPAPVREGEFRWLWYKLIPTNVQISVFEVRPVSGAFRIAGTLPSGELYRDFSGLDADFSYEMTGDFGFSVKIAALPDLARRDGISNQAGLEALETRLAGEIRDFIVQQFAVYLADGAEESGTFLAAVTPERLLADVAARFPDTENHRVTFTAEKMPDFGLYRRSRDLFGDFLAFQRQVLSGPLETAAGNRIETRFRLEELARYGELLTRYPVLLDYLTIENGGRGR